MSGRGMPCCVCHCITKWTKMKTINLSTAHLECLFFVLRLPYTCAFMWLFSWCTFLRGIHLFHTCFLHRSLKLFRSFLLTLSLFSSYSFSFPPLSIACPFLGVHRGVYGPTINTLFTSAFASEQVHIHIVCVFLTNHRFFSHKVTKR